MVPDPLPPYLDKWLRKPDEKDRVFPKNKKIEVIFLVEAVNAVLLRTEGVEDITLIKLPGTEYEIPVILPEKLQAVTRRRMVAQLRRFRDEKPNDLKTWLERLANIYKYEKKGKKPEIVEVGFIRAEEFSRNPAGWNCFIQPPGGEKREATDVGMDGFCPACLLFGAVLDKTKLKGIEESIGVKSRVEFDPAFSFLNQEKSTAGYTHNKVSDGISWTGESLYKERHVIPGTIFVGKVTLEDVTETELKAFLAVLAGIDRLGGRERLYGGVRVHLVGIRGGNYETISALGLARLLAKEYEAQEYPPSVDEVKKKISDVLGIDVGSKAAEETKKEKFVPINSDTFKGLLDDMNLWNTLWSDAVEYGRQVVERVLDLVRDKYEKA